MFVIRRLFDGRAVRRVNSQVLAERIISTLRASGTLCYLDTAA